MAIMNAATSSIVTRSPYVVRTSFTQWQVSYPLGQVAIDPESRHITPTIYLREIARSDDGAYCNREIEALGDMDDPGLAAR